MATESNSAKSDGDPPEFVCTERIKFRKLRSQNIVHRLRYREIGMGVKTPQHSVREFYQNVYPNLTVVNVEKPPCYLRKFSPDGRYLIAFSSDQASLEIYQYMGCAAASKLFQDWETPEVILNDGTCGRSYEIRSQIFDKLFKVNFYGLVCILLEYVLK